MSLIVEYFCISYHGKINVYTYILYFIFKSYVIEIIYNFTTKRLISYTLAHCKDAREAVPIFPMIVMVSSFIVM